MKTTEVNETLIGKAVEFMCRGFKATGNIIGIVDNEYSRGVEIELTSDIYDYFDGGCERVNTTRSTSRKMDDFGNLSTVVVL